jgi:hypothetical protein
MQVSSQTWSLPDLEVALGPYTDHGNRIKALDGVGVDSESAHSGPFTFDCGCLAVGFVPNLLLRACSQSHASLKSVA